MDLWELDEERGFLDMCEEIEEQQEAETCTPPELRESVNIARGATIPEKSKKRYELIYRAFKKWLTKYEANKISENILLAYFRELSNSKAPNTLWAAFSMLKSMFKLHHDINIDDYDNLHAFLKNRIKGYRPKKAKVFQGSEITQFLKEASDMEWLLHKVYNLL